MLRRLALRWIARGYEVADSIERRSARLAVVGSGGDPDSMRDFAVIAHRGASADAPENTLPAFREALLQGAREIELDVQLSRDGEVFVFHDASLAAKTGARGAVRDHAAARLRELEIGGWFDASHPGRSERFAGTRLATLAEVLAEFGERLRYQIELKAPDAELPQRALAVIDRHGLRAHVTLTSFHSDALARARALDADVATCALVRTPRLLRAEAIQRGESRGLRAGALLRRAIETAVDGAFDGVALAAPYLEPRIVDFTRSRGLRLRAWRVRSEADLDQAVDAGAEAATVDWPGRARAHLSQRRSGRGKAARSAR